MSEMKITGIDLAKTNFYLFSINAYGKPAGKSKLSRSNLLNWLVQQYGAHLTPTYLLPALCKLLCPLAGFSEILPLYRHSRVQKLLFLYMLICGRIHSRSA
ncbi:MULTISPECIES: hypothetical protein [Enterobacter]|uniref:hypothetical protein n=1 Tax=Enterobacter TaxID=547 RepID=UPI000B325C6B|nr:MULTISPECIES: hypothetical protein [Enterobacter]